MTIERKLTAGAAGDFSASLNTSLGGWSEAMGLRFTRATADEVEAELEIGPEHRQAYGIVHGGVHSGVIETVASVGAALTSLPNGQSVVGVENHTSFLLAVREGKLHASARPLMRGRRTQVWDASITDDAGRTVASGRVRFIVLEKDSSLAGEKVGITRSAKPQ